MNGGAIARHCFEIERCNQRGGRMLSIVDLLEAGTVPVELAAYALAAIEGGASFLVGARPGGAGKTTVMGALLNFVPAEVELAPADGLEAIAEGRRRRTPRRAYICHEIGAGGYYAYLWGEELRAYFALLEAGHILATNLHADTGAEAQEQICRTNGVPEAQFRRVNLLLFLAVARRGLGRERRIVSAWESDGSGPHRQVYAAEPGEGRMRPSLLVGAAALAAARGRIERLRAAGARTIAEVRAAILRG